MWQQRHPARNHQTRHERTKVVESLLLAGADVNARDTNSWSSLHVSIANNREEVFFALLSFGGQQSALCDIEVRRSLNIGTGWGECHRDGCCAFSHMDGRASLKWPSAWLKVTWLSLQVDELKTCPPCSFSSLRVVYRLWMAKFMVDSEQPSMLLCERFLSQAVNSNGDTPLHMAAYHGHEWAVLTLLRLGADCRATNDKGQSPFQVARYNTVRSMLKSSVKPGGTAGAASAGDVEAGSGVGIPTDNDLAKATRSIDVRREISHRHFGQESERPSSGAGPSGADAGREGKQQSTTKRCLGNTQPSTNERSDGGVAGGESFDRLVNGRLISSLISTDALEGERYSFHGKSEGDLSFEEGSSEGELSLESEGGIMR